jgi:hypothetical protein
MATVAGKTKSSIQPSARTEKPKRPLGRESASIKKPAQIQMPSPQLDADGVPRVDIPISLRWITRFTPAGLDGVLRPVTVLQNRISSLTDCGEFTPQFAAAVKNCLGDAKLPEISFDAASATASGNGVIDLSHIVKSIAKLKDTVARLEGNASEKQWADAMFRGIISIPKIKLVSSGSPDALEVWEGGGRTRLGTLRRPPPAVREPMESPPF